MLLGDMEENTDYEIQIHSKNPFEQLEGFFGPMNIWSIIGLCLLFIGGFMFVSKYLLKKE
jgi:hypothetical protein